MQKVAVKIIILLVNLSLGWTSDKHIVVVSPGNPLNLTINTTPFVNINDGYYYFGAEKVNWYIGYENCRKLGAELVTFETAEEFDAIARYLKSKGDRSEYWTSGNDLGKTGTQRWFSNAQLIDIKKWAPMQPDNGGGIEHCIHLGYIYNFSRDIQLNDRPCNNEGPLDSLFKYICSQARNYIYSCMEINCSLLIKQSNPF